jgi:hypothetical protein
MRFPALATTALLLVCVSLGCEDRAPTPPPSTLPPIAPEGPTGRPGPRPTATPADEVPDVTATPGASPDSSPESVPEGQLVLTSSVEAGSGGEWIVRWSVRNPGTSSLYLVAQLPTVKGGRPAPDPNAVYLRADGETLHLTKRMWRVPRGVSPLITELPYLVRLDPGQSHAGAIRLPPAVASKFPYRIEDRGPEAPVSEVVVSMGYFSEAAGPQACPDHEGLYLAPYSALESQAYVTSEPHAAELRVR